MHTHFVCEHVVITIVSNYCTYKTVVCHSMPHSALRETLSLTGKFSTENSFTIASV